MGFDVDELEITAPTGSITTGGDGAYGVYVYGTDEEERATGSTSIDVGTIKTTGESARAVRIYSAGLVSVKSKTITTGGSEDATGMLIDSTGPVVINSGTVETTGVDAIGIQVLNASDATITSGRIVTQGVRSLGIQVTDATTSRITSGLIETHGNDADGIEVSGGDRTEITNTTTATGADAGIKTTGVDSSGIVVSDVDVVVINGGSITTSGEDSDGIRVVDSEDVTIKATSVALTGDSNTGVSVSFAKSANLDLGTITTSGEQSRAVYFGGGDNAQFTLKAGSVTTTGFGSDAINLQSNASSYTLNLGTVRTEGEQSDGITSDADTRLIDITANPLASLSTTGEGSRAAYLRADTLKLDLGAVTTEGLEATGLYLEAYEAGDVKVARIETSGADADGLVLESGGDSSVVVGTLRTSGVGADGIVATSEGDLTIGVDDVRLTGQGAMAINAFADGDVAMTVGYVDVTGAGADAIVAEADGKVSLAASRRVASATGAAANLTGTTVGVTLASTAVVTGATAGLLLESETGSTVTNAGSIASTGGYAIDTVAGKVTLNNSGLVTGRVRFAGGDDVVTNSGRFTASGTSDFGAGSDVFTNTGTIDLAAATTARSATFANLERLNNAGTINLTNGAAGDVFTVSGVIEGQGANTIAMDLDLRGATPAADRIVAGGFAGLSHVMLTVQGEPVLGETGVVLAQSGMAQSGAEIDVDVVGGGFVKYNLSLAGNAYMLNGELAIPAFEPTKIAAGAQHQWTSGADVVSSRFEQMRDEGAREGQGLQVWSQVFDGSVDIEGQRSFEIEDETVDADLTHEVKSRGLQAGIDRTVPIASGSLAFGALASTGETELLFQNGDRTRYDGIGVGAYGHWANGPLSVGVLAKIDRFDLDYDWAEAGVRTKADGMTRGLRLDAAWRVDLGETWFVEPQGSVSWSDTSLGSIGSSSGLVGFGDTRSLVGKVGLRAGGRMVLANGLTLRPYAGLHALNEFEGDNASTLHLGSESIAVQDEAQGAWSRATLGASLGGAAGLAGFVQAEQDFGEVEGFTARVGLRYAW